MKKIKPYQKRSANIVGAVFVALFVVVAIHFILSSHAATPPSLPAGVTLQPIDGGPNYYCSNGFTYACEDGWDSPSFFPIGPWYGSVSTQADVNMYNATGMNTLFRTSNTNLALVKSSGLYAIVDDEGSSGPETSGMGTETVGLLSADEPTTYAAGVSTPLGTVPNAQQDGRFWYLNNTWNFIQYGGLSPVSSSASVLSNLITTPNGTQRHIDVQSVDEYWFSGAKAGGTFSTLYQGGLLYNLGVNYNTGTSNMTAAEAECGCRYGDMVDTIRAYQTTYPAPIAQLIENGGPYTTDTSGSDYITPPELNWAVWSSIIHGARMIIYFSHTFGGPAQSDEDLENSYYSTVQPGQTTSIYAQTAATDALIKQMAPEINSPSAIGYVTTSPAYATFSGIETVAKYYNNNFYIFADTRDAETATNIPVTYTIKNTGATSVTVVGENRTIPITNGGTTFTDTFANGSTVHIYEIDSGSTTPTPSVSLTATPTSISSGDSTTLSWTSSNLPDGTTCSATSPSGWTSSTATSGSQSVSPTTTTTYTITCGSTSSSATVTVTSSSGSSPPTVSITSPTANTSVHGKTLSVASTATANDGGSITNAKLYVNNTLVQTLTSAPYNFTLDTTGYTDGSYTLKVQATDDQNNTTSQSVAVNITNGDFNGDGIVGLSDLIILAQNYGKTGTFSYSQGNITGATTSPEVGLPDLIILAQNYNYNDGLGH